MLFRQDMLRRIVRGEVSLAFRRWRRPTVRAGGTLRTSLGVLAIEALQPVEARDISEGEARQAGYTDRAGLLRELRGEGTLYRIAVSFVRDEPRAQQNDDDELGVLCSKLRALDSRALGGAFTTRTLRLIRDQPGVQAAQLAEQLSGETEQLKRNVRKLKELGLVEAQPRAQERSSESLELGYRLTPCGLSVLARLAP